MKVEVCVGSACMLMGSLNILDQVENLEEIIAVDRENYKDEELQIEAIKCMGLCKVTDNNISPVVVINGEPLFRASSQEVMERILSKMRRV
ncbi:MAG: (2Fe-2S) ferredoxin domain-containing protein [Firmicutes bacterium]|jgi:NADH:ubiquinone oxidoreductase subunit E|nr:(2Fe-2S) ferredoxin domain-containing protein [Bacillota bacterium]